MRLPASPAAHSESVNLSERVLVINERFPPDYAGSAFDGIDVLILATNRLSADPSGKQALRRWVEQGGTMWVLLDKVNLEEVAPFFGEDFDFRATDRVHFIDGEAVVIGTAMIRILRLAPEISEAPVELARAGEQGMELTY